MEEGALKSLWRCHIWIASYHFKFFKGCLPQIWIGLFLNTLTRIFTDVVTDDGNIPALLFSTGDAQKLRESLSTKQASLNFFLKEGKIVVYIVWTLIFSWKSAVVTNYFQKKAFNSVFWISVVLYLKWFIFLSEVFKIPSIKVTL